MRHRVMVFLTAMAVGSCDNLFYRDMDPFEPAPVVLSVIPENNATGAYLNTVISIRFSRKMDLKTVESNIIVKKIIEDENGIHISEERVGGTVCTSKKNMYMAIFSLPSGTLFEPQQKYTVTIKRNAKALSGKRLDDEVVTEFKTGGDIDSQPPGLVWVSPEYLVSNDNKIRDIQITIEFDEPINHQILQAGEISLTDLNSDTGFGTIIMSGDYVTYSGKPNRIVVQHVFTRELSPDKKVPREYRIDFRFPSSIQDLSGNHFDGAVIPDPLSPRDPLIIKHIWRHVSPVGTSCWLSGEDSECGQ